MNFTYQWFRVSAMAWLVVGRPKQAEAVFDEMLRRWPGDAYALASRSHVRAQAGRFAPLLALEAQHSAQEGGNAQRHRDANELCGVWHHQPFARQRVGHAYKPSRAM